MNGIFYCDGRKSELLREPQFRPAYHWIVSRMRANGIKVRSYPVWAWYRHPASGEKSRKPPLPRAKWESELNVPSCRIELDVPDEQVLLSDFEMWHCALNSWIASDDFGEWDLIEAAEKEKKDNIQKIIEKTWERIFLIDKDTCKSLYSGDHVAIQACIPYINSAWVTNVDHYTVTYRTSTYKKYYGWK